MDIWHLFLEIAVLVAAAMLLGILFERLRQSALLGYLLAGMLLGPGGFKVVDPGSVAPVAELGVALLLFTIGLEFSIGRLRKLGAMAIWGGALQVLLTGALVTGIALLLGFDGRESLALGAMIPLSSTACVLRLLGERTELETNQGRQALGILLLQDIAVVPLVLLITVLGSGGTAASIVIDLGKALGFGALLIGGFFLISRFLLPRLFDAAHLTKNHELPILLALATCLGATWLAHAFGLSPALGAFVAGVLLAESSLATQIRADVGSFKTLFVTLFFVAIGMLAEWSWVQKHILVLPFVIVAILSIKALVILMIGRIFNVAPRHALATGLIVSQIGEFSFVLAESAHNGGVLSNDTFEVFMLATFGTLFLTPFLVRGALPAGRKVEGLLARVGWKAPSDVEESGHVSEATHDHLIIVGFGPAGQGVARGMIRQGVPVLVVDLNPRSAAEAERLGVPFHVGDASKIEILRHAHLEHAIALVITLPDHKTAREIIHQSRALAPEVPVMVRARYHRFAGDLLKTGATAVYDEEVATGKFLEEEVLRFMEKRKRFEERKKAGEI